MIKNINTSNIKYDQNGLVPVIVQEANTGLVLMLAYMNEEALTKTIQTEVAHYYSRSRQLIWMKGETSGNIQQVKALHVDCDQDTLLLKIVQDGVACHTNHLSCFFEAWLEERQPQGNLGIIRELEAVILNRNRHPIEGSYTSHLLEKGLDKILKKVGEEATEVVIAAKSQDQSELVYETADLIYHMLTLLVKQGIPWSAVETELDKRRQMTANPLE
ncbi:MAG: bifunctional phosphoribosyl-AMP cyclohydrolase/phosphoribosyl-ATP diphosphatase HisIE [Acholeplasmataceae bacterium]|nr:MAG: bifunctional phosphoribosyl-AMP cyclohydrolase/phosphoribosyl-ATP diphosphatase HisIE [Acholeplasmataceae bacterium]